MHILAMDPVECSAFTVSSIAVSLLVNVITPDQVRDTCFGLVVQWIAVSWCLSGIGLFIDGIRRLGTPFRCYDMTASYVRRTIVWGLFCTGLLSGSILFLACTAGFQHYWAIWQAILAIAYFDTAIIWAVLCALRSRQEFGKGKGRR